MLYRKIEKKIADCLQHPDGRMTIVDGARQVGKSFIIREVGQRLFPNYIEVNMEEDKRGDGLFAEVNTVGDFYLALSTFAGDKKQSVSPHSHWCRIWGRIYSNCILMMWVCSPLFCIVPTPSLCLPT